MASVTQTGSADMQVPPAVQAFAAGHYQDSGAGRFGISPEELGLMLAEVVLAHATAADEAGLAAFLASLHLEELVLARGCAAGNNAAWEIFLTRYRSTLFETAYKVAKQDSAARSLADSLYAELYGVGEKGQQRPSKLLYYQGRGSLQGWLRTVVAQEYVNHCRRTWRETSLEAVVEDGRQFAAVQPEPSSLDPRLEQATAAELAALDTEARFLLAAYYIDRRTLAEISKLLQVHESTVSRKLDRIAKGLRKSIHKRLTRAGMSHRQADEAMEDVDVRDLQVGIGEKLRQ